MITVDKLYQIMNDPVYVQIALTIIAGLWGLYLYFREGLHRPRIEFDIKCNVIGKTETDTIVEFQIIANNKGKIKFTFHELFFRLRGITRINALRFYKKTTRLEYPELVVEENLVPEKYGYYYLEPGTTQTITYVTKISSKYQHILANASFKYKHRTIIRRRPLRIMKEKHTCERAFHIKKKANKSSQRAGDSIVYFSLF
jgi:hypothetical protein